MTSHQISLVQQTFALVRPMLDKAAMAFYDPLFEL
jgi:hypothetical protein